ncbi:hypothetical protein Bca52824_004897 [Brassica carinata]|uniref:Ubiquitin-like protease family profile domain-containing protein n=1 Tax=Brassica carinata TaxID=52824 RepID=A0A8X8BH44_BRACI|nr:hypothetical protein Bca52824_004897 [Brassica carinata]
MSTRKKEKNKEKAQPEEEVVNGRLPPRLFATDRYPSKCKHNCNSSLEYLLLVRDVLEGTDEMEQLLGSCFGSLFRLPVRRCAFSAKIVHGMLTRQVVTKKRYELWPVFGGYPLRFSLAEFGYVTGLPCGEFEDGYVVEELFGERKKDFRFWDMLFGGKRDVTIADVASMVASDREMPMSRKLKLCLIIIVDGVLLATNQSPKPTLKHVNLLKNLKRFLSFPWGREAFWWTISTMLPPPRQMGRCEDPEEEFCRKLRQKSKILAGFPLALQLWAFEAIPCLLKRLGGTDEQKLLDFVGEKLPQHTGLSLSAVLDAEHDPQLTVQPMVECGEDKEEGWGEFDCEIHDRKVVYMVDAIKGGHDFKKWEWGGGDSTEPKYEHTVIEKEKKRKKRPGAIKDEGPALKQRRLSRYFSRKGEGDGGKLEAVETKLEKVFEMVVIMKKELERQGRMLRKRRSGGTGKFGSSMLSRGRRQRRTSVQTGRKQLFDESDCNDSEKSTDRDEEIGVRKNNVEDEDSDSDGLEGAGVGVRERVVVPLKAARKGDATQDGHQVYFGSGSNKFDAAEEEVVIEKMLAEEDRGIDEVDFGELNKLVGSITGAKDGGTGVMKDDEIGGGAEAGAARKDAGVKTNGEEAMNEQQDEDVGNLLDKQSENVEAKVTCNDDDGQEKVAEKRLDGEPIDVANKTLDKVVACPADGGEGPHSMDNEEDEEAVEVDKEVMEVSDSSPCKKMEKHKPVESEGDLASLLLAKEPFSMDKIVPEVEDNDYPFFESVLLANPKVLHVDAGGHFDLDNEFFLDLGTTQKWVSTQHMEVLVDYLASRHEDRLRERRCLFLPPWFAAHLQGKSRPFNAAKFNKGRVLVDGRLTSFLTKEGKKWGEDVDTLYTPMIWKGEHWVGLCISLIDWRVLVLDPNPRLREMKSVSELMETVSKMIPYLVEKVCPPPAEGAYGLDPFVVERMGGAYENRRSGDCGPVAIKLMELHALGNPDPTMAGLTDELVDIIRKQFAMDVYKDWVVPLYMRVEEV